MNDNTTFHFAGEYDLKIEQTIPCYSLFHEETIQMVRLFNPIPESWLDTGCGTGTMAFKAMPYYSNTRFVLADPSEEMLAIARNKLSNALESSFSFLQSATQEINHPSENYDVITAIQSHHYLDYSTRVEATNNCYRMLKEGGIYITFENIRPTSYPGISLGLSRWKSFQINRGKSEAEAENHVKRFDKEYFPITIEEHLKILREAGFTSVEILWASYMQAGFYAIK